MVGDFRVLGPLEIRFGGRLIQLGPPKRRVLALTLLLTPNRPVPLERLVDAIWEEIPPASAVANVRTYAAGLRATLGDQADQATRLETVDNGYLLHVEPGELDLARFDAAMDRSKQSAAGADAAGAAEQLRTALGLWRGRAGEGLPIVGAAGRYLETLDERRLLATEDLAEAMLLLGDTDAAISTVRQLLVDHPLRERAWGQLMRARYGAGDAAGALSTYAAARQTLIDRLGVEPSPELTELHRSILRRDPALARPAVNVTVPIIEVANRAVPRQLPPRQAVFVGRNEELAALTKGLQAAESAAPVLAIHGMGGTGKSALAIEFAHRVAESFPDGQLYCDLHGDGGGMHPLDPAAVVRRFVAAFDPHAAGSLDGEEILARYRTLLASRKVLIIVDNAADETQVRPLVPVTVGSALLVTSRRMLVALDGASQICLAGLPELDAIDLLAGLAGAERVRADSESAARLAALCGCLPLALRITGARLAIRPDWTLDKLIRALSVEHLRLDELNVSDLSVRSCFESSFQALATGSRGHAAQHVFHAFGVLGLPIAQPGPVAAIAGLPRDATESALDDLVASRLLEPAESGRYRAHDLLLLYAAELARPSKELAWAGYDWYLAAAAHAVQVFRRNEAQDMPSAPEGLALVGEADAVAWLEAERNNLLALARRAASGETGWFTIRIGRILSRYLPFRGGWGDLQLLAELALAVAGDPDDRAWAEFELGMAQTEAGDVEAGVAHLETALLGYRRIAALDGQAMTLDRLGIANIRLKRFPEALRYFDAGLEILRQSGDESAEARTRCNAAWALFTTGDYPTCQAYLERALTIRQAQGDRLAEGVIRGNLSRIHRVSHRFEEALAEAADALRIALQVGNRLGECDAWENLRDAHAAAGNAEAAGEAARRLNALRELIGDPSTD